jgi:Transposase DDE domain group 1
VGYLRPSSKDGAHHAWAILSLLVKGLRKAWTDVQIIFRGDSGFCHHKMLEWCDRQGGLYIVGIPRNQRLEKLLAPTLDKAQQAFDMSQEKQKKFTDFVYSAKSWKRERRIIGKAEVTPQGTNPRFIVPNLEGESQQLYKSQREYRKSHQGSPA